jgi:oligopeptide transport system permease protein
MSVAQSDRADIARDSAAASRSLLGDALARFRANRAAMGAIVVLVVIAALAILIPEIWPHDIADSSWDKILQAPNLADWHWFGTDANGRDLFVRTFYGARISLAIGLMTTAVALLIGVFYGALAGMLGGAADAVMMRVVDILYALPLLFFIILMVTIFGKNIFVVFLAIGCVEWLTMARIVRGQTLSIKGRDYMDSARAAAVPPSRLLSRYIIPNAIGPVIVYVTLLVPVNIIVESYLSFLGLGVQEPLTSWGLLISQGASQLETAPWLVLFPATLLAITLFAFNFIGDGLRDAFDPKDR